MMELFLYTCLKHILAWYFDILNNAAFHLSLHWLIFLQKHIGLMIAMNTGSAAACLNVWLQFEQMTADVSMLKHAAVGALIWPAVLQCCSVYNIIPATYLPNDCHWADSGNELVKTLINLQGWGRREHGPSYWWARTHRGGGMLMLSVAAWLIVSSRVLCYSN